MPFLSDEQRRMLDSYIPALSNIHPGIDLAQILDDLFDEAVSAHSDTFTDGAAWYTSDTVGAAFGEVAAQFGNSSAGVAPFAENNVLADNDPVYDALEKLDLFVGDLASAAPGEGASLVGVEDSAGFYTSADVEGVLDEVGTTLGLFQSLPGVIAPGSSTGTVAFSPALVGKPAFAMIQQALDDATLTVIQRVDWAGGPPGTLTVAGNAVATAPVSFFVFVDGR